MLRPGGLLFASFDTNGDYLVTPEELAAGSARAFAMADADGDGMVSLVELADWRARAFGARDALPGPYAFDANQDRTVTRAEFTAALDGAMAPYVDTAAGGAPFSALVAPASERRERGQGLFERGDGPILVPRGGDEPY